MMLEEGAREDIDPAHPETALLYYEISNPYRKRDSELERRRRM